MVSLGLLFAGLDDDRGELVRSPIEWKLRGFAETVLRSSF